LHYDVAYFGEPMVNYRKHDLSMTSHLTGEHFAVRFRDGLAVLWRIHNEARALGYMDVVRLCRHRLAFQYGHNIVGRQLGNSTFLMTVQEFEDSLHENAVDLLEGNAIRARTWEIVADRWFRRREFERARSYYALSRRYDGARLAIPVKQALLGLGAGDAVVTLRDTLAGIRETLANSNSH